MSDLPQSLVTLTETSFVVALWNVSLHGGDWMAVLYRDEPGAAWRAMTRFRWYVDERAWDSNDHRQALHERAKDGSDASRDALASTVDVIAGELAAVYRSTVEKIAINGDAAAFAAAVRALPQFHTRTTTIEPDA